MDAVVSGRWIPEMSGGEFLNEPSASRRVERGRKGARMEMMKVRRRTVRKMWRSRGLRKVEMEKMDRCGLLLSAERRGIDGWIERKRE